MITEAIYGVLCAVLAFLLELLPDWTAPAWIADLTGTVADAVAQVGQLGAWIPLGHIAICVTFLLAVSAVVHAIRIARITVSGLTGGGGSAA